MKRLDWFIAQRYLSARKKGRFLSIITWIALGGVTVGVGALVAVNAVMTGMQKDLKAKILDSTPHVIVMQTGMSLRMEDWPPQCGVGISPFWTRTPAAGRNLPKASRRPWGFLRVPPVNSLSYIFPS